MTNEVKTKKAGLRAADIFAATDRKTVAIEVQEWGGTVYVQTMTADEASGLSDKNAPNKEGVARVVVLTAVDENGNRLFSFDDIPKLQQKSFRALLRVQEIALELNGLTAETQVEAKKG
jgi:hypothetical protein